MASTSTPGTLALERAGIEFSIHEYESVGEGATYGEAVAESLGVSPARLFKTLIAEADGTAVVAIVPSDGRLWLKGLARAAGGKKAQLADPGVAERLTGYVTGGISPFGQKRRLPVYVDESIQSFETVYVSGGRRGIQVEVRPADLIRLLDATPAPLTE